MRTLVLILLVSPVLLQERIAEDENSSPTPSCLTSPTPGKNSWMRTLVTSPAPSRLTSPTHCKNVCLSSPTLDKSSRRLG